MTRFTRLFSQKWLVAGIVIVIGLASEGYGWWSTHPDWIQFGSVGSRSLSLAWTSKRRSDGCVVFIKTQWPFTVRSMCLQEKSRVHLIQMKSLELHTQYVTYITVNNVVDLASFRQIETKEVEEKPRLPLSLYGNVIHSSKTASSNALVVVQPAKDFQGYPELTVTNEQGRWAVDGGVFGNKVDEWHIRAVAANGGKGSLTYSAMGGYMPDLEVDYE